MSINPSGPVDDYRPENPPPYDFGLRNEGPKPVSAQFQPQLQQAQIQPRQPLQVVFFEFEEYPMRLTCPHCDSLIITKTENFIGNLSYLLYILACIFIATMLYIYFYYESTITKTKLNLRLFIQFCSIVFILMTILSTICSCFKFHKNVSHYCPSCNHFIGKYRRTCAKKVVRNVVLFAVFFMIGYTATWILLDLIDNK